VGFPRHAGSFVEVPGFKQRRSSRAVLNWAGVIEEEGVNEFAGQSPARLFCWAG